MSLRPTADRAARTPLTREQVLDAAMALADRIGVEALTIRKLASELGVGPMTIYHHVPSKEAILDGMVDIVFSQIAPPPPDLPWKVAIRDRCLSARTVLRRHPWAPPLMESRTSPGPETLGHHEAVLTCLREGGLSLPMTAHAYAILDSFVYGFALQEANLSVVSDGGGERAAEVTQSIIEPLPEEAYPRLVELARDHVLRPGYDFGDSFEVGLDLLLDGLETEAVEQDECRATTSSTSAEG